MEFKILPAKKRTVKVTVDSLTRGKPYYLAFPEMIFGYDDSFDRLHTAFLNKRSFYPVTLPNVYLDGRVCLEMPLHTLDRAVALFWNSEFTLDFGSQALEYLLKSIIPTEKCNNEIRARDDEHFYKRHRYLLDHWQAMGYFPLEEYMQEFHTNRDYCNWKPYLRTFNNQYRPIDAI